MNNPPNSNRWGLSIYALTKNSEGGCLVLKRADKVKSSPGKWDLPGGKVVVGESLDEALRREVREETGLGVELGVWAGAGSFEMAGTTVAFIILEARSAGGDVHLSPEHADYRWVSAPALLELEMCPYFNAFVEDYCRTRGYTRPRQGATNQKPEPVSTAWLEEQVRRYEKKLPVYRKFANKVEDMLKEVTGPICPMAQVQVRVKSVASFAEKILRKNKYTDPLAEITDLCGARVVTQIKPEAEAASQCIKELFEIDKENSQEDTLSRLGAKEFGYRSVHYVVQLKRDKFPGLREDFYAIKAEIQVRTILQHGWSDIGHDRLYKGGFHVPSHWQREGARLAAALESADDSFARLVQGLEAYRSNFGAYLKPEEIQREMETVRAVLRHDPDNASLAHRLARLAISREDWTEAIKVGREFQKQYPKRMTAELFCCLGAALCQLHKHSPASHKFQEGRTCFRKAVAVEPQSVEARVRLAETAADEKERLELFNEAFHIDPLDPAVLSGYVRQKILVERSTAFVPLLRPSLEAAIAKCQMQVDVGVNIPHALYWIAGFRLLLGTEHEWTCLDALAQAVKRTDTISMLDSMIEVADALAKLEPERRDAKCALRMLLVARQALGMRRAPSADVGDQRLKRLTGPRLAPIRGPVVIVAGGCDPALQEKLVSYRELLRQSFADFTGTIVSGGTVQGISGLVGELGQEFNDRICTVGYHPATLPPDKTATLDERYMELRSTDGEKEFSALEPLQNWIDLLLSGIQPKDVRVVGINGGRIAAFEYRLAWALGAQVAVVRNSGREADEIQQGIRANEFDGMLVVPEDALTLRAFLHGGAGTAAPFTPDQHERLARLGHAKFLEENRHKHPDRAMRPWDELDPDLKDSNLGQVAYMTKTLQAVGYVLEPLTGRPPKPQFSRDEIELMARMEHGRWNLERIQGGWQHAKERDPVKKLSPHLVAWEQLPDSVKDWDRKAVLRFPHLLAEAGFQVVRRSAVE
jgi:ppGpp synthetase/RelA/SpoT-type nucleotidyltranferase/8-oxo-dGTP pyrophosphatase MutT (NUDIX family)